MKELIKRIFELGEELDKVDGFEAVIIINEIELEINNYVNSIKENKTHLIKRIEELAVENDRLKKIISVDFGFKENETVITKHPFSAAIEIFKEHAKKAQEVANLINSKNSQDFKKGDILIREWKDGDIDYCKFKKMGDEKSFYDDNFFYRIKTNGFIEDYSEDCKSVKYENECKFNWRQATQKEIDKLNKLLGKEEPKEEVWWLNTKCVIGFTPELKYKQGYFGGDEVLTDDDGDTRFLEDLKGCFTKVDNELEEAIDELKQYQKIGEIPSNEAIEKILKHLE